MAGLYRVKLRKVTPKKSPDHARQPSGLLRDPASWPRISLNLTNSVCVCVCVCVCLSVSDSPPA